MSVAAMPLARRLHAFAAAASSTLQGRPPLRPLAAAAANSIVSDDHRDSPAIQQLGRVRRSTFSPLNVPA
jgi:hypothetical protein